MDIQVFEFESCAIMMMNGDNERPTHFRLFAPILLS